MTNGRSMLEIKPNDIQSFTSLANFVIDAADHKLAYKFYAESTSPITHVDIQLYGVGNTSGCSFKIRIETDSGGSPSGSILGAATGAFAGPSSSQTFWAGGGTDPLELATPTGNLTLNAPYWAVVYEDGTNPDGSNYIQAKRCYASFNRDVIKLDDGSNAWTHATAISNESSVILKHADGNYQGNPLLSSSVPYGVTSIYDNNKQAALWQFGSSVRIGAFIISLGKSGSPTNLMVRLFEGSTLKDTLEINADDISNGSSFVAFLSTPCLISANTNCYLLMNQKGTDETDGGDGSNFYRMATLTAHPTYYTSLFPNYPRLFGGTSTDPTALTEAGSTEINLPTIRPLILDVMNGLYCPAASGGSSPRFGDRTGGKN